MLGLFWNVPQTIIWTDMSKAHHRDHDLVIFFCHALPHGQTSGRQVKAVLSHEFCSLQTVLAATAHGHVLGNCEADVPGLGPAAGVHTALDQPQSCTSPQAPATPTCSGDTSAAVADCTPARTHIST